MTEAGHQWAALVSMLAGEPLPVPPATGAARQHHADGFSPATEKHLARVFGNEDRANFRPPDARRWHRAAPVLAGRYRRAEMQHPCCVRR